MRDLAHESSAGLVLVYTTSKRGFEPLVEELERLAPGLEVQVVRELHVLESHLEQVRADVIVADMSGLAVDRLARSCAAAAACGPTIVLDATATPARRAVASDAGAVAYLEHADGGALTLAQLVATVYRAGSTGVRADETRRYLQDILEASSDGIFVLVDGRFYYVNDVFALALGLEAGALVGHRTLVELVPEADRERVAEDLGRVLMSGGMRELVELRLRTAGGAELRFEVALRASVVEGQRALVGIARDVTASHDLQQEIERARQRMAQVERMRALGELAAGVAHDFNNAIGTIVGRVVTARQRLARGESVAEDLGVIELASRNAAGVVQRIREFSRPTGTDTWQEVDLGAALEDAVALVRAQVPDGVVLELRRGPAPRVQGNAGELREVFVNLLRNALDAVGRSGTVRARCHGEGDKAIVEVVDDGPGMGPEVQEHLFEPFFTTKGERGTGLGLSVSRWILRRHDAQLDVRSAVGEGTAFMISFAPLAGAARRPVPLGGAGGLTILVVDDDRAVAEMIKDLLGERGHEVRVVHNPAEAAQELGGRAGYDLMITDLDLPGMSGWQLARRVRELQPRMTVGLITGWPIGASEQEIHARGVDFVLSKPFTADALHEAVLGTRRPRG